MDLLIGKYVPNLTAKPFEISRAYVNDIFSLSGSPVMEQVPPPHLPLFISSCISSDKIIFASFEEGMITPWVPVSVFFWQILSR